METKAYLEIKNVCFDAMLAGYICNPSSSSYSAERLAKEYGLFPDQGFGYYCRFRSQRAYFRMDSGRRSYCRAA